MRHFAVLLLALHATSLAAQQDEMKMQMPTGVLGIPETRAGSGTSWLPDSSYMHATHFAWAGWSAMLHGDVTAQYDRQGSRRGDGQFGSVNWGMLMLMRPLGGVQLHLNAMVSLEPATLGGRGYPLLLQTGESYGGQPLHDHQHPHDAFMELAVRVDGPLSRSVAVSLYAGAVGEPALGPVAYMHRPSTQNDPFAPLSHHQQDATHITFGVVTAGVYAVRWKLEGSVFNGREPDDRRWNFDYRGRSLDSYSGRVTVNPTGRMSLSGWYGYLRSPEVLHPDESVHRFGASLLFAARGWSGGEWSSSIIWGANRTHGSTRGSLLAESNLELGSKTSVFGRLELTRKSGEDLDLPAQIRGATYGITVLALGSVREIASIGAGTVGVGVRPSINFISRSLATVYGTRRPVGIDVFVRFRPGRMTMGMTMDHELHGAGGPRARSAMRDE